MYPSNTYYIIFDIALWQLRCHVQTSPPCKVHHGEICTPCRFHHGEICMHANFTPLMQTPPVIFLFAVEFAYRANFTCRLLTNVSTLIVT